MKTISFTNEAWTDFLYWVEKDQKKLKKINLLIAEINRNPFKGSGKPEPLKFKLAGYWSRRIDKTNRLVYKIENERITIISCKGHY
ncbi:MAG: Txe/YoeB family addiction module toxin [Draconibacterium sp.]|nr:Txe/YoeB family addiction module toxin [Draconibacterium sp.]